MNRQRSVVLVFFLLLAAVISWMGWRPVSIWCRKYALERSNHRLRSAFAATTSGEVTRLDRDELLERRTFYCERLVALGYFVHRSYELDKLPNSDEIHEELLRRAMNRFPNGCLQAMTGETYVIDVYDMVESKPHWDAFIAECNVVDFAERYSAGEEGIAEPANEPERPVGVEVNGE